jgi:hypothetical protein
LTRDRRVAALVVAAPAAIAALLYAATLQNGLVYDDPAALEVARAPLGELLVHRFGLTYLSIRLDEALWGGWLPGFHLTNVLLHATCSALAALLTLHLTGRPLLAFLTGGLFAVHPVHVEVVASIENRKDMLAMILAVTSVLLYRARRRPALGWAGSLVALLLALHAKDAAAIGVVGVLPLAGLLPRPDHDVPWAERVAMTERRVVPLVALGIAATVWYGGNLAGKLRSDAIESTTASACTTYGCVLGTSAAALPQVVRLLVWPARLSADYRTYPVRGLLKPPALAGISLALGMAAAALVLAAPSPVAAFAVTWIGITYLPVSNVVPLTPYFLAERYLYLPSYGFCLLVAMGLERLLRRRRVLLVAVAAAILAAGAMRSLVRIRDWRDDLTLWTAALRAVPEGSARIHGELGRALSRAGRAAEALPHLQTAVDLDPLRPDAHSDLGLALLESGRPAEAIPAFRRSLDLWPDNELIRFNLARTLLDAGERDEAVALLRMVASEEAWRNATPAVRAALAARGMTPEEFRRRVQIWLDRNAAGGEQPPP